MKDALPDGVWLMTREVIKRETGRAYAEGHKDGAQQERKRLLPWVEHRPECDGPVYPCTCGLKDVLPEVGAYSLVKPDPDEADRPDTSGPIQPLPHEHVYTWHTSTTGNESPPPGTPCTGCGHQYDPDTMTSQETLAQAINAALKTRPEDQPMGNVAAAILDALPDGSVLFVPNDHESVFRQVYQHGAQQERKRLVAGFRDIIGHHQDHYSPVRYCTLKMMRELEALADHEAEETS